MSIHRDALISALSAEVAFPEQGESDTIAGPIMTTSTIVGDWSVSRSSLGAEVHRYLMQNKRDLMEQAARRMKGLTPESIAWSLVDSRAVEFEITHAMLSGAFVATVLRAVDRIAVSSFKTCAECGQIFVVSESAKNYHPKCAIKRRRERERARNTRRAPRVAERRMRDSVKVRKYNTAFDGLINAAIDNGASWKLADLSKNHWATAATSTKYQQRLLRLAIDGQRPDLAAETARRGSKR